MDLTGNGNKYAFQSEKLEGTSEEVVAFEQDKYDVNSDKRTEKEKVESLPRILQSMLKWQVARHKLLIISMSVLLQGLNAPLFFGYIFNNAIIGIVMGIYNILYVISLYLVPDYGTGEYLNMIVQNQEKMAKQAGNQISAQWFVTFISTGFFMTFQILALNPESRSHNVFGWVTPYLIYANFVIYPLFSQFTSYAFIADGCMGMEISNYFEKIIKAYITKMKECLLKYDVKKDNKDECLEEISKAQAKIEKLAFELNGKGKVVLGLWLIWLLGLVIVGVIMIWVLQTISTNENRAAEIVGLSFMTLLSLAGFILSLVQVTSNARTWENERKKKLNDSKLQIKIDALFGRRFNEWMDNHEVRATRAFNFQVTPARVMEIGSLVGSLCTIAGYFIIKEELRALM